MANSSSNDRDYSKMVVTDDMVDYVLAKYGNKWGLDDAMVEVILEDLWQMEYNQQEVKKDKGIGKLEALDKRITNLEVVFRKAKEAEQIAKFDEVFGRAKQAKKAEQKKVNKDDTISLEFLEDTSRKQRTPAKKVTSKTTVSKGSSLKVKMLSWYFPTNHSTSSYSSSDSSLDTSSDSYDAKLPVQAKKGSNSKHIQAKHGSSSNHLQAKRGPICKHLQVSDHKVPTLQAKRGSSSKHLQVPDQKVTTPKVYATRPPPIRNCILDLAAVHTWECIGNKTFGIRKPKNGLGARKLGKRKMVYEQFMMVVAMSLAFVDIMDSL